MHADSPSALPLEPTPSTTFAAEAGGAPGVLARILEAFTRRDIAIDSLAYNKTGDHARLEVRIHDLTPGDARQVAAQIRQVIGVTRLDIGIAASQAERMRLCA